MTQTMNAAVASTKRGPSDALFRHCLTLGAESRPGVPVKERLEQALGPELARRLVRSLTAGGRRRV